jgi:fructose-bisphosphate aldolase class II
LKFATMKEILKLAEEKQIAYGAFVTVSYDSALAAIEAGSELNVPVIFITGVDCVELMGGFEGTVETIKRASANSSVPVALHLDHSKAFEDCVQAINAGYSSVMIDGSSLPFEENVAITRKVVDFAHPLGITVEGELGKLVGEEGDLIVKGPEAAQTDPEEAKEFVARTGVDCLAVSIGTQHGHYIAAPKLNIERLKAIHSVVNVPLVLHGGSGTPTDQVQESIRNGIRKINVATDVLTAMVDEYVAVTKEPNFKYNTAVYPKVKDAMKELIKDKMRQFRFES